MLIHTLFWQKLPSLASALTEDSGFYQLLPCPLFKEGRRQDAPKPDTYDQWQSIDSPERR